MNSTAVSAEQQTGLGVDVHPVANIFPMMHEAAFQSLKADIEKHSLQNPIVYHQNSLIDGRNRLRACKELGIEPSDCELDRDADPVDYILSANLHRRHLTTSQRAMCAAKLAGLPVGSNQHSKGEGVQICTPSFSAEQAADLFQVSRRSVFTALEVLRGAPPEVVAQVEHGDMAVSKAAECAPVKKAKAKKPPRKVEQTPCDKTCTDFQRTLEEVKALGRVNAMTFWEAVGDATRHDWFRSSLAELHHIQLVRHGDGTVEVVVNESERDVCTAVVSEAAAPEPDEPAGGWCLICGSTTNCDCAEKFGSPTEVLGHRDADEPALVTCRNCGGTDFDADGDCTRCWEPGAGKIADVKSDGEQLVDSQPDEEPADDAPPRGPRGRVPRGVIAANEAINALCRIPKNDALRERGFQIVSDWITANGPQSDTDMQIKGAVRAIGILLSLPASKVPLYDVKVKVRKLYALLGLECPL